MFFTLLAVVEAPGLVSRWLAHCRRSWRESVFAALHCAKGLKVTIISRALICWITCHQPSITAYNTYEFFQSDGARQGQHHRHYVPVMPHAASQDEVVAATRQVKCLDVGVTFTANRIESPTVNHPGHVLYATIRFPCLTFSSILNVSYPSHVTLRHRLGPPPKGETKLVQQFVRYPTTLEVELMKHAVIECVAQNIPHIYANIDKRSHRMSKTSEGGLCIVYDHLTAIDAGVVCLRR